MNALTALSEPNAHLSTQKAIVLFLSEPWKGSFYSTWTEYARCELGKSHSWASRIAKMATKTEAASKAIAVSVGDIDACVRQLFTEYLLFSELRVGCGFGNDGERTMDMWGISQKRPFPHIAIEIKRSRSDFRVDLRSPLKQRRARLFANMFYYAAPSGLLAIDDLPPWAGLVEVGQHSDEILGNYMAARITTPAPWFDSSPPTWSFVAHLVRQHKKGALK